MSAHVYTLAGALEQYKKNLETGAIKLPERLKELIEVRIENLGTISYVLMGCCPAALILLRQFKDFLTAFLKIEVI